MALIKKTNIKDASNIVINPATEDTLLSLTWTKYDILIDEISTPNITYIWEAIIWSNTSDSKWRIKRINETSWINIWWAWSNNSFDKIWDNRTSLTYSK